MAKQLDDWELGGLATTEVEADFVDRRRVHYGEGVVESWLRIDAALPVWMTQLDAQTQAFEAAGSEIIAVPFLRVR